MSTSSLRVGFIGLGKMGRPMCSTLAAGGFDVTVFDAVPAAMAELARTHAVTIGESPADLAERCDAIIISVPGPAEDEDVLLGPRGILAGARPGTLVLDATTIGVPQTRHFAERAKAVGAGYLDTPVSIIRPVGGTPFMTFMVGGEAADFVRARPVLDALAAHVHYVGPSGAGSAAKLLNQAIYVGYMTLFGEALALAEGAGVAVDPLLDALATASAGLPNIVAKYDELRGRATTKFPVDNALKYLDLTAEAFPGAEAAPLIRAATASLRAASRSGYGAADLIAARHAASTPKAEV